MEQHYCIIISLTVDANATQWDLLSTTDILREMSVDYIA